MTPEQLTTHVKPGVCATLWTPGPMSETLTPEVLRILLRARPQIICLHGVPKSHRLYAASVWKSLLAKGAMLSPPWRPRLWIAVGCDTPILYAAHGLLTEPQAASQLIDVAAVAAQLNAELIMWNAESGCKRSPASAGQIARTLVQKTRERYQNLVQAHTAYGSPVIHPETDDNGKPLPHGYPWSAWCDEEGVDIGIPQDYAAPDQPEDGPRTVAPPGALRSRIRGDVAGWKVAMQRHWVRNGLPRWPYVQLHHVPFSQTATYATDPDKAVTGKSSSSLSRPWVGWTVEKDRCDTDGEIALCIAAELYRRGKSISQVQSEAGITVDGVAGPDTARVLGIEISPRR